MKIYYSGAHFGYGKRVELELKRRSVMTSFIDRNIALKRSEKVAKQKAKETRNGKS